MPRATRSPQRSADDVLRDRAAREVDLREEKDVARAHGRGEGIDQVLPEIRVGLNPWGCQKATTLRSPSVAVRIAAASFAGLWAKSSITSKPLPEPRRSKRRATPRKSARPAAARRRSPPSSATTASAATAFSTLWVSGHRQGDPDAGEEEAAAVMKKFHGRRVERRRRVAERDRPFTQRVESRVRPHENARARLAHAFAEDLEDLRFGVMIALQVEQDGHLGFVEGARLVGLVRLDDERARCPPTRCRGLRRRGGSKGRRPTPHRDRARPLAGLRTSWRRSHLPSSRRIATARRERTIAASAFRSVGHRHAFLAGAGEIGNLRFDGGRTDDERRADDASTVLGRSPRRVSGSGGVPGRPGVGRRCGRSRRSRRPTSRAGGRGHSSPFRRCRRSGCGTRGRGRGGRERRGDGRRVHAGS
jgi:hypothetical protein